MRVPIFLLYLLLVITQTYRSNVQLSAKWINCVGQTTASNHMLLKEFSHDWVPSVRTLCTSTSLNWRIVKDFFTVHLCCSFSVQAEMDEDYTSSLRSFRHHFLKRAGFALIPAAFVVGMITTLLSALTVVSIKSLGVGVSKKFYVYKSHLCNIFSNYHKVTIAIVMITRKVDFFLLH